MLMCQHHSGGELSLFKPCLLDNSMFGQGYLNGTPQTCLIGDCHIEMLKQIHKFTNMSNIVIEAKNLLLN